MTTHHQFQLSLSIQGCRGEARLNGIPIHTQERPLPLQADFPVNHWLARGDNRIELLLPDDAVSLPDTARCLLTLRVRLSGESRTISHLSWRRDLLDVGDPIAGSGSDGRYQLDNDLRAETHGNVHLGAVRATVPPGGRGTLLQQALRLDLHLPAWAWLSSPPLCTGTMNTAELQSLRDELWQQIHTLNTFLLQGRPEPVVDLCDERNRELDQAFARPAGTTRTQLLAALAEAIHAPDQTLAPLHPRMLGLDAWPNDRLIRLARADFSPAIAFVWRDPPMTRSFDFVFRRGRDGWVVCR